MQDVRVAVLRGGPSEEYSVSMQTGMNVLHALRQLGYQAHDVVITRRGEWLDQGIVRQPEHIIGAVDLVFIALHGAFGEDGTLQRFLDMHSVPYTGSGKLTSKTAFNKILTKDLLQSVGVMMPKHYRVTQSDVARLPLIVEQLHEELGRELFIKPITGGSSVGADYAGTPEKLQSVLEVLLKHHEAVMVEQFIRGKEATVAVLDNYRRVPHYVLPVIEIVPPASDPFFTYENKYNGATAEICPGRFSYHEKAQMEEIARRVHQLLNCRHYSRSDFIIKDGAIYFLEVNTLPGLTSESLFPKAAEAVGLSYASLIDHLVTLALQKKS
jgi:D-alanine-D-alanine ligase